MFKSLLLFLDSKKVTGLASHSLKRDGKKARYVCAGGCAKGKGTTTTAFCSGDAWHEKCQRDSLPGSLGGQKKAVVSASHHCCLLISCLNVVNCVLVAEFRVS